MESSAVGMTVYATEPSHFRSRARFAVIKREEDGLVAYALFEGGAPKVGNFKPLKDRVLVQLEEQASETTSGIALATEGSEEPTQGEVVSVGEGGRTPMGELLPMGISPGENVLYGKYAGTDAFIEGKTYKVVTAGECLAKW